MTGTITYIVASVFAITIVCFTENLLNAIDIIDEKLKQFIIWIIKKFKNL